MRALGEDRAAGELREHDPRRVGPWLVERRLGAGGMGVVYLGRHEDGRRGAVKVIADRLVHEPAFRSRFAREIRVLERVEGPFVAGVIDADAWAAPPYLVTQFVGGTPLHRLVDEGGALPPDVWSGVARGLLLALVRVHAAGIVHRDIQPSNVLVAGDRPCLIDFGVAAMLDGTATATNAFVGTLGWMAPERMRLDTATPASDMFSLGAVLAHAGTGRPPFGADGPVSALTRVLSGEVDLRGLGEAQRELVVPMLRQDPRERPTAADALVTWNALGR